MIINYNIFAQSSIEGMQTDSVIHKFQQLVTTVENFFESNPVFLDEQSFYSSPTKKIFMMYKHTFPIELKYDVLKTESIISPYSGYTIVKVKNRYINNEGGYPTLEECLSDTSFGFWHTSGGEEYIVPATFTYNFAYQNGEWIFKEIVAYRGEIYDDDWEKSQNQHWLLLFKK
jgi:hypothetical protein